MRSITLGGLECCLVGGNDGKGGGDGPLVVLLHGFGAPARDLVPFGEALDAPKGTRFLFPGGSLSMGPGYGGGRAWWMIDIARLEAALMSGALRDLSKETPAGMAEAHAKVVAMLDDAQRALGADPARTVLGGFSQGAMLTLDVALRTARPLAGLVLLSGTLLCEADWTALMPRRAGLRVFQSHGTVDPLLAFSAAERLRDLMVKSHLVLDWAAFRGGHEIPPQVLNRVSGFLGDLLAPRPALRS